MPLSVKLSAKPSPPWQPGQLVTLTATVYLDDTPVAGAAVMFEMSWFAFKDQSGDIMTDGSGNAYYSFKIPTNISPGYSVSFAAYAKYPWPYPSYYASGRISGVVGAVISRLTLSVSPNPPWKIGQPVTLTVEAKDQNGNPFPGRTITFYVSEGGAAAYGKVGTCTTGSNGKCSIGWSPKVGGDIKIMAVDPTAMDGKSNVVTGYAEPQPEVPCIKKVTIFADKTTVSPGDKVTVYGKVLCDSTVVPNYSVILANSWTSGSITIYTDYKGEYRHTLTAPSREGTYYITAAIPGDQKSVTITVKSIPVEKPTRIRVITTTAYIGLPFDVEGYLEYQDVDGNWKPLGGQTVELLDVNRFKTFGTGATDNNGKFKISDLLTYAESVSYYIQYRGITGQYKGYGSIITIKLTKPTVEFEVYASPPPPWYQKDHVVIYGHLKIGGVPYAGCSISCAVYVDGVYTVNLAGVRTGDDGTFRFGSHSLADYGIEKTVKFVVSEGKYGTTKEIVGKIVGERREVIGKPWEVTLTASPSPPWYVGSKVTFVATVTENGSPVVNHPVNFVVYPFHRVPGEIIGSAITDSKGVASLTHTIKSEYGVEKVNVVDGEIEVKASAYHPYLARVFFSPSIVGKVLAAPPLPPEEPVARLKLKYRVIKGALPITLEITDVRIPGMTVAEYVRKYTLDKNEDIIDLGIMLAKGTHDIAVSWKMTDSLGATASGVAQKTVTVTA